MNPQTIAILEHLKEHGTITPLEALELYGCFRLSARIYELRQAGYKIDTKLISNTGGRAFAEYHLD